MTTPQQMKTLKIAGELVGETIAAQPAIPEREYLCPVCQTHHLRLDQLPNGKNYASHFMPKGDIGSGEGCQVMIEFIDWQNLEYILEHWSE